MITMSTLQDGKSNWLEGAVLMCSYLLVSLDSHSDRNPTPTDVCRLAAPSGTCPITKSDFTIHHKSEIFNWVNVEALTLASSIKSELHDSLELK